MKHQPFIFLLFVLIMALLAGCGSSPEEIATMTAAAWTPTPLPTATLTLTPSPTPVPFDVTVNITDQEGNPVPSALVTLSEAGDGNPVATDDEGQVTWNNLPGEEGVLSVFAQGYLPAQQTLSLERGPNEVTVAIELDPYGLLPSDACMPGEIMAYAEDFQDGHAQGWDVVEYNAGGWSVDLAPDIPENTVLILNLPDSYGGMVGDNELAQLREYDFNDAVLRFRLFLTDHGSYNVYWRMATESYQTSAGQADFSRYTIFLGTTPGGRGPQTTAMSRQQEPIAGFIVAARANEFLSTNEWHFVEISTFEGVTKVWLDGMEMMEYSDPAPIPGGKMGFAANDVNSGAIAYYDDIRVCNLSTPFASMYIP